EPLLLCDRLAYARDTRARQSEYAANFRGPSGRLVTARALWREFHRYVSFSRDSLGAAAFVAHAGGDLRLESGDADVGGTEAGPHPGNPCESSQTPRWRLQSFRHFQRNDSRDIPYRRNVLSRRL